jgi:hypothetical protein
MIKIIRPLNIKTLFNKDIKIICLSIGGFYTVFGAFALLMVKIQKIMISNFDQQADKRFSNTLNVLHEIWIVYMPLMILIGVCYLIFGLLFKKIKTNKYQINLVLSIFSMTWVITYAISCIKYFYTFFAGFGNDFAVFKYIGYGFAGFGFIAVFALFTVPQYLIGKSIKRQGVENEQ